MLRQLHREDPDAPGRTVHEDLLPRLHLGVPQKMQRRDPTKEDGGGFVMGHVGRLGSEQPILCETHVFGMSAELESVRSENLVAGLEPRHGSAHRLDSAGELGTEDLELGAPEPVHESYDERIRLSHPPVRRAHRRRVNANEDFVVVGNRFGDVCDFENVGRTVSGVDRGFHGGVGCSCV